MSDVLVSGAGTEACNGLYIGSGTGQEAVYTGPNGYFIQYNGFGAWLLADSSYNQVYCDDWMWNTNPWESTAWFVYMTGKEPAPTVTEVSGFSISGTVELADESPVETVKLTATASGEDDVVTYTDENGDYTLENLADETTWRVTPTKLACTFSPTYHDVTLSGANQSGKDFTATLTGHNVSGTVADASTGVAGATVSATDGVNVVEAETDEYGAYTLENLPDGAWTITCALAGYAIFWASRTITVSGADLDHVDFVALPTSVLLLHLNSDLTDSSRSGHTLSAVGNAAIDTGTKKFGAGSLVLDGTGDYLLAPADADWNLADLPFTIHAWVNLNSLTGANRILGLGYRTGALKNVGWGLGQTWGGTGNFLKVNWCQWNGSGYSDFTSALHKVPTGEWHHLAVVREGLGTNEFKMYLDGVAIYTGTNAATFVIDDTLTVGCRQESDEQYFEFLNGHIDELVVVKGRALWTANFTPPSAETVENWAVTGTILDGSSNPVPGVLVTATASGESDVTAYTGPDGKYALGGLTDSTTWRLTPTKTDWTFTETYEDVEVSGADETDVDFVGEEEGGGEVAAPAATFTMSLGWEAQSEVHEPIAAPPATFVLGLSWDAQAEVHASTPQTQPDHDGRMKYEHNRSQYQDGTWRRSAAISYAWAGQDPPATAITRGMFHALTGTWYGVTYSFADLKTAGFNLVMPPRYDAISGHSVPNMIAAAEAAEINIMPIVCNSNILTTTQAVIEANDSSDRLVGWYVQDEPNVRTDWQARLALFQRYKADWNVTHPLSVCCASAIEEEYEDRFRVFASESAVIIHDNYGYSLSQSAMPRPWTFDIPPTQPTGALQSSGQVRTLAVAQKIAESQSKEQWNIIQGHGRLDITTGTVTPPVNRMRASVYHSLICGATGYIVFAEDSWWFRNVTFMGVGPYTRTDYGIGLVATGYEVYRSDLLWAGLQTVNSEIAAYEAVWLSRAAPLEYLVEFQETSYCWSDNPIASTLKLYNGDYYLFIVNIENFAHPVRVTLPFTPSATTRLFGALTWSQSANILSVTLQEFGTWGCKLEV